MFISKIGFKCMSEKVEKHIRNYIPFCWWFLWYAECLLDNAMTIQYNLTSSPFSTKAQYLIHQQLWHRLTRAVVHPNISFTALLNTHSPHLIVGIFKSFCQSLVLTHTGTLNSIPETNLVKTYTCSSLGLPHTLEHLHLCALN